MAYDNGEVDLHANVRWRVNGKVVDTTVGRVLVGELLPPELPFDYFNTALDKKAAKSPASRVVSSSSRGIRARVRAYR